MDISIRRNLKPLKWYLAWIFLHMSNMVHQVAVGFENFEDFFLIEKMLKKVLNADLSLILGRDGGLHLSVGKLSERSL